MNSFERWIVAVAIWASSVNAAPNLAFFAGAMPAGVATDSQGNIFVAGQTRSTSLPVTAGALQATNGGSLDAFVAKLAPDGTILWCTYYGGKADDIANSLAVDFAGNVWVTGYTQSSDLPLRNPYQAALRGGFNAFLLKLGPDGQVLSSSYLGGAGSIIGNAIAVDSVGSAYVTGSTTTEDFPGSVGAVGTTFVAKFTAEGSRVYSYIYSRNTFGTTGIAVDGSGSAYVVGKGQGPSYPSLNLNLAFVFKLSPDGTHLVYETFFGGSYNNDEAAIVLDSTGAAYIAGTTDSADFPQVHSLQSSLKARPLWKSTDGGNTWSPIDNLPFAYLQALVPDPIAPGTLYAGASDLGVFKSVNGGNSWTRISNGISMPAIYSVAVNPTNPAVMFAGGGAYAPSSSPWGGWLFQTKDGGQNWSLVDSPGLTVNQVVFDSSTPSTVYAQASVTGLKSTDSGATWNILPFQSQTGVASFAADPKTPGLLYAYSVYVPGFPFHGLGSAPQAQSYVIFNQVFRSTDGGATWQLVPNVTPGQPGLVVDSSTTPATIYAGTSARSSDGGKTWTSLTPPFAQTPTAMAADPASGTLYAAASISGSLTVSTDRGQTWNSTGWPASNSSITAITPTSGALYATVQNVQTSAFVVKLNPAGTVVFSTLLSGHPSLSSVPLGECGPSLPIQCGDPTSFSMQNYAAGIALDPAGNIVVAGGTRSSDFPTANPAQSANAGGADGFVAVISADGSQLQYSSYLGGSKNDGANGVAVDTQGNIILAGVTDSTDFAGGTVPQNGTGSAFAGRVVSAAPTISAVLSAASFQPGIESGSWVMIKGTNLANTTRTWRTSDFSGDNLPVSLDGVSVTIDGKAAFVEYISPTQINVQAPLDSATGAVNVVVTNNGRPSAPSTAQLQTVAPAFFMSGSSVIASVLPSYTAVTAAAPAHSGDLVVLWATGFGPTTPAVSPGVIVSGAPATATLPIVTIGGMQVPVINAVMTDGTVGLYQVTIQLPANVPTGAVALQAAVAGAHTQAGVTLTIAAP